jgi:hypothetical protein
MYLVPLVTSNLYQTVLSAAATVPSAHLFSIRAIAVAWLDPGPLAIAFVFAETDVERALSPLAFLAVTW